MPKRRVDLAVGGGILSGIRRTRPAKGDSRRIKSPATHVKAMLDQSEMRRLVDMQRRSYLLLKWMAKAVSEGFINFKTAHDYSTLPEAAEGWILGHYLNIPENARPPREDLPAFCDFFSTYLTNSLDLISNPGKQLYSPDAHCFCPMCSWLVDAPNLKTKKVQSTEKRRAQKMRVNALLDMAAEHGLDVGEEEITDLLNDRQTSEDASLVAYGYDLLQRAKGIANGPAVLVLWRGFAWNERGSPKHGFRLKAKLIVAAEERLLALMQTISPGSHAPHGNPMPGRSASPNSQRRTP